LSNPITDVLWWINSEVDKLSGVGLPAMHRVLDQAQRELVRDLSKAKWLGTDDRYTAQTHRNALMQIEGALDHINTKVAPEVERALVSSGHAAGAMAVSHLAHEVAAFSSIFEGTVRPIAFEAASIVAKGDRLLYRKHQNSAARYAGQIGDDIRQQLAVGMVRGETIDQMVKRLQKDGGPKGLVYTRGREGSPGARAEYIAEGLFKRYRYWGERLARTETVNAYNEAALIGMDELEEDDPGYYKRWDAAIDGRLCKLCRAFDDRVVPLHKAFPLGFQKPPRHPNCRCAVVIWRKEWDEADVKDDLTGQVTKGKEPSSVASIPHKFDTPAKPTPPEPTRRARRPREEVRAEREARELERQAARQARAARQSERAVAQAERAEARAQRSAARELVAKQARMEREARARAREEAKATKQASKKLVKVQSVALDEDAANIANVKFHKKQPFAETFHESFDFSRISESQLRSFRRGTKDLFGRELTMEEMSHGFAPPDGYMAKVINVHKEGFQVNYFDKKTGRMVAELHRDFWKDGEIHHSYFVLAGDFRGGGFSDAINGRAMARYEKWGVKVASVDATWVGRYAWARMGFNFKYPSEILDKASTFIRQNIPMAKQAEYLQKLDLLVKEPWKLAKWDEGGELFKVSFNASGNTQTGEYPIGKAIMLHDRMHMWGGLLPISEKNPGYLNALRLVKAHERG
jgi:SPP1 gp7 family putative phage head morphogenesis protein